MPETDGRRSFLRSLRDKRAAEFRKEVVPYFRYVAQSGFGLLVSAVFFSVLIYYFDLMSGVPEGWPASLVGVVLLALAALYAPYRSYLRPADTVFLLSAEAPLLEAYVLPAVRTVVIRSAVRACAASLVFAPIYSRAPETADLAAGHPWPAMAASFAALGAWNAYGGWREKRFAANEWRRPLKAARWLIVVACAAGLLLKPLALTVPFMVVFAAAFWVVWRLPASHALPWERLIEDEAAARRRWMSFLGWFVDVPTETSKPAGRRWAAWLGDAFAWREGKAWHYLYAKTLLRGDLFGALLRWVIVSCAIVVVAEGAVADSIAYGLSMLVSGMQLGELRRVRFVETADTLPIPPEGRLPAAASVARAAGLFAAALPAVAAVSDAGFSPSSELPLFAAGLLWCGWHTPRRIAKRRADEEE